MTIVPTSFNLILQLPESQLQHLKQNGTPCIYYILTWILGVVSKQLRLLHGRVRDSTTSVNYLSPQMSELDEDAVASWCSYIVGHFWLIRNELQKFVEVKFKFFSFNTFWCLSDILAMSCTNKAKIQLLHFLEGIVLGFCLLDAK